MIDAPVGLERRAGFRNPSHTLKIQNEWEARFGFREERAFGNAFDHAPFVLVEPQSDGSGDGKHETKIVAERFYFDFPQTRESAHVGTPVTTRAMFVSQDLESFVESSVLVARNAHEDVAPAIRGIFGARESIRAHFACARDGEVHHLRMFAVCLPEVEEDGRLLRFVGARMRGRECADPRVYHESEPHNPVDFLVHDVSCLLCGFRNGMGSSIADGAKVVKGV